MPKEYRGSNAVQVYRDVYIKEKVIYGIRAVHSGISFLSNNILVEDAVFSVRKKQTTKGRSVHAFVAGKLIFDVEEMEKAMVDIRLSKDYGYYDQRKEKHFYNQCGKKLLSSKYAYMTNDSDGKPYVVILEGVYGYTTDFSRPSE